MATSLHMQILSINVSEKKGESKTAVPSAVLDSYGICGDAHSGPWDRQISILSQEIIKEYEAEAGRSFSPGDFAENFTISGLDLRQIAPLDHIHIGHAELEVTQIGKDCHGEGCHIFQKIGKCLMPRDGIFCRVVKGGRVHQGDVGKWVPRPLRVQIVTVSDRVSSGHYPDKSGPHVQELLENFFQGKRWHPEFKRAVTLDDAHVLKHLLEKECSADIIFTSGGTGIGPRDITVDTVNAITHRTIPGIMERIRTKYGQNNPNALLSRSVAAVFGETIIFTLPGHPRAVSEYLNEILPCLEHLIFMLHGLDTHH